jgi:3-phosphoshikimate 1-carboxyvinyltransferase
MPGDKSISHRYAILASIAEGPSRIHNYSTGADCQSTLSCMRGLGVEWTRSDNVVEVQGRGLGGLKEPVEALDARNSGSTIRMLSGILAAQPFVTRIGGDESLSRRPMERIMTPLREMGGSLTAREGRFPPLEIHGGPLRAIDYALPVASAQVKSCILFAGLYAPGTTTVRESIRTRDHSELALQEFGADITMRKNAVTVEGPARLTGRELTVPGDLSSAAFFLAAASIVPGSDVVIESVGLNPTRAELIDFLIAMGADIQVLGVHRTAGELVGDLRVRTGKLRGGVIDKALTAALIDEIPVLAVLGARSEEGLAVRDAAELRIKETDRIATIAENLQRMGVSMEVLPDGFHVLGRQNFRPAELDSFGDHRIAMAFSIAALVCDGECSMAAAEAASVSYPEFFMTLQSIAA